MTDRRVKGGTADNLNPRSVLLLGAKHFLSYKISLFFVELHSLAPVSFKIKIFIMY